VIATFKNITGGASILRQDYHTIDNSYILLPRLHSVTSACLCLAPPPFFGSYRTKSSHRKNSPQKIWQSSQKSGKINAFSIARETLRKGSRMEQAAELPEDIQSQMEALSEQGEEAMDQGRYEEALDCYNQALGILPEPRENWEAYVWLKAALGDACFLMERLDDGLDHFYEAYTSAGPQNVNPFIVYRLGQIYKRMDDEENAVDFLMRAWMLEGEDVFEDEEDLLYLRNRVHLDDYDADNDEDEGYDYDDDDDDYGRGGSRFDDEGFSRGYIPRDDYEEYGDD
jgi:tetratricopeptide (TPR) repeat protein